jgi:hypothetical protein
MAAGGNTDVEHSPHLLKGEGSSPAHAASTQRENDEKVKPM